jgi:hypothetical protein
MDAFTVVEICRIPGRAGGVRGIERNRAFRHRIGNVAWIDAIGEPRKVMRIEAVSPAWAVAGVVSGATMVMASPGSARNGTRMP